MPTIVPKTVKPIERTPRRTLNSTGVLRRLLPNVQTPDDLTKSIETETDSDLTQEAILQQQINDLQKQGNELNTELSCKNKKLSDTKKVMRQQKFCIDRFNNKLKAALDYLNPAANSLAYWGSNTNIKKIVSLDFVKRESKRTMTTEEELCLTLVRLRCVFPIEDLSVRFNLSLSSISRI